MKRPWHPKSLAYAISAALYGVPVKAHENTVDRVLEFDCAGLRYRMPTLELMHLDEHRIAGHIAEAISRIVLDSTFCDDAPQEAIDACGVMVSTEKFLRSVVTGITIENLFPNQPYLIFQTNNVADANFTLKWARGKQYNEIRDMLFNELSGRPVEASELKAMDPHAFEKFWPILPSHNAGLISGEQAAKQLGFDSPAAKNQNSTSNVTAHAQPKKPAKKGRQTPIAHRPRKVSLD